MGMKEIKDRVAGLGMKTLAIIAALIVVASAATVAYLSNVATATATVDSPFAIYYTATTAGTIGEGQQSVNLGGLYGGDSFTLTTLLRNRANTAQLAETAVICSSLDKWGNLEQMTGDQLSMALTWPGHDTPLAITPVYAPDGKSLLFVTQTGDVSFTPGDHYNYIAVKIGQNYITSPDGALNCVARAWIPGTQPTI
jgi:hypothetical protein